MYGTNIVFQNCEFSNNAANSGTRGIFIGFSNVNISDTTFDDASK